MCIASHGTHTVAVWCGRRASDVYIRASLNPAFSLLRENNCNRAPIRTYLNNQLSCAGANEVSGHDKWVISYLSQQKRTWYKVVSVLLQVMHNWQDSLAWSRRSGTCSSEINDYGLLLAAAGWCCHDHENATSEVSAWITLGFCELESVKQKLRTAPISASRHMQPQNSTCLQNFLRNLCQNVPSAMIQKSQWEMHNC